MQTKGFTLLELLITVALVAVLASFALPSFRATVQNNQLASCSNKLIAAVQLAKSEAVTLRQTIVVASDLAATNQPAFRIGTDPDGGNDVDDADIMQTFECQGDGVTITPNLNFISFGSSGFRADGQGQKVFMACNELGRGVNITVSTGGAVTTADAADGSCP